MVELVVLQSLSYIAGALGVCIAAIYYVITLRINQKTQELSLKTQQQNLETRQAQLFRDLLKTHEGYEFTKIFQEIFWDWSFNDFEDFMAKYSKDTESRTKSTIIFGYLEGMGIMMRRGLISPDLVYEYYYNTIIGFWEKYAPIVEGWRIMFNSPQFYEPIEWLYGEMKRIQVVKGHGFNRNALKLHETSP